MELFVNILKAILALGLLGLMFGALLAFAGRIFAVKTDARLEPLNEALPGANCAGCGYSGCAAYAGAILAGEAATNRCSAGGDDVTLKLSEIMGVTAEPVARRRAQVMCSGARGLARIKYEYIGIPDCNSAMKLSGGDKLCPYGCLGLGSCADACKFDAIEVKNGVAAIKYEKCRACGACASACPKRIIKLIPYDEKYWVGCSSRDKGSVVRSYCDVGCMSCKLCEKACAHGAIRVDEGVAAIDYARCRDCGDCVEACPRKVIWSKQTQRKGVFLERKDVDSRA